MYRYKRITDASFLNYAHSTSGNVIAPRLALNYAISKNIFLYAVTAKGFSPPSLAEIHPSDGLFHTELKPEYGWNEEVGWKGGLWHHRFEFDMAFYYFHLNNAIVSRNNAAGNQYFVNAGGADEKGIECWMQYHLLTKSFSLFQKIDVFSSYSYQPYYFTTYLQGNNNYSGNAVTGVPQHIHVVGLNMQLKQNWYANILYNTVDAIPLNDANDEYANAYHLLQCKLGKTFVWHTTKVEIYMGGDNLLNELYSLGNDINAAGRRYYNPAAARNFYGGVKVVL